MRPIGICGIGTYVPPGRVKNEERLADFGIEMPFLEGKLGVRQRSVKAPGESTADLCLKAVQDLQQQGGPALEQIECMVVVTQNPEIRIPHLSAQIHGSLGLPETCACFDISLGCSGYVYGLATIQAFMQTHGLQHGLLLTADPYSPIIDQEDKNTALLFGDAATCTWLGPAPVYTTGRFTFGTIGKECSELTCPAGGHLYMNGRAVFNFAAKYVPADVRKLLTQNNVKLAEVDRFIFHQGSKYIVDTLARLLQLDPNRVAFDILDYGNTVSSSIPLILVEELKSPQNTRLLISGFGAGLSWASTLLTRIP